MTRLFIVEDEAIIAMDLAEQLEEYGYEIVGVAHDGESALEQLSDVDPHLILMDIVLGNGQDGIQTAEKVLQSRSIPIIFLTAFSDPETVSRAAKVAPYGYVTKPYNAQSLQASIEIALTKHQLEHKLLYKERWFSNVLHAVHDGILAVGIDGLIHFANAEACRILNVSRPEELMKHELLEVVELFDNNGDPQKNSPVASAMQRNAVQPITFNGSVKNRKTGQRIFVDYTAAPVRGPSNAVIGGLFAFRDASQRLQIESEVRKSDGRFQTAFNNSSVGVGLVSLGGTLIECNPALSRLFNLPEPKDLDIIDSVITSYEDRAAIRHGQLSLLSGQQPSFQFEVTLSNPTTIWLMLNITLLHDTDGNPSYYFYQIYDQTDRKQAEQKLYHLANYDSLTGLMNLHQLKGEIDHLIEISEFETSSVAVMTLDIDRFDAVNDKYGLAIADKILAEIATRLVDIGLYNVTVGRAGGDRFVLVMHSIESINQAMFVATKALDEIREPYYYESDEILLTACAGIALGPDDGINSERLLNASSEALYLAKLNGRNQVSFFNDEITSGIKGRINNEIKLSRALDNDELSFQYLEAMPTAESDPHSLLKMLLYWPEKEIYIYPESFYDIANHSGITRKLMTATLHQCCGMLSRNDQHMPQGVLIPYYPAIIESDDFLESLADLVRGYNLKPELFIFSFTSRLINDGKSTLSKVDKLKQHGFRLCLNIYTGQSASVDLLYNYSPAYCEFTLSDNERTDEAYLKAVIGMTEALKIPVILSSEKERGISPDVMKAVAFNIPSLDHIRQV